MLCRMGDLRSKEVINTKDGSRLGFVCDLELDPKTASLAAVVVYGRLRLFGLLGREQDLVIPWGDIALIGDDTLLVHYTPPASREGPGALARLRERLGL